MQLDRKIHPPQSHVLHDERIDPGRDQLAGLPLGGLQFVIVNQGIERGMHPHAVTVGILRDTGDLLRTVARRMARSELRTADIDGVGAVIHGGHGRLQISGGSE